MSFTLYPVSGEGFVGRQALVGDLTAELSSKNRVGYSLYGIRRIGKTSVLKEVGLSLRKQNVVTIYISSWRILPKTTEEFARLLARTAIAEFDEQLPVKFKFEELLDTGTKALGRLLSGLKLSAKATEDLEVSLAYVRRESNDVEAAITKSFSLIDHLAEMTKTKCVLMLDEFPSLVDLTYGEKNQKIGEGIIQLLRTLMEDFKNTKLVVSGSYRDTLSNLVARQKSPFYKQLLTREVSPFDREEFNEFLDHYLPDLRFKSEEAKETLYHITSGIPYNLQLLGKEIRSHSHQNLDRHGVMQLVDRVLKKEGDQSFMIFVDDLAPYEIKTLKAMSRLPHSNPIDLAREQFMEDGTVNRALSLLNKRGILTRLSRGSYEFTDNLFAEWLRMSDSSQIM
ncbi:MAG: AAA family ATPase [Nitrososphaerales archaeon]